MNASLMKLHARAAELGWHCLSQEWAGYPARYRFECAHGHRFERHANTVFYQQPGCPGCEADAIRERWMASVAQRGGTLAEMQAAAVLRGGRCLSAEYRNARVKLTWECDRGHVWEAVPGSIKRGSWCPNCWRLRYAKSEVKRKRYDVDG